MVVVCKARRRHTRRATRDATRTGTSKVSWTPQNTAQIVDSNFRVWRLFEQMKQRGNLIKSNEACQQGKGVVSGHIYSCRGDSLPSTLPECVAGTIGHLAGVYLPQLNSAYEQRPKLYLYVHLAFDAFIFDTLR